MALVEELEPNEVATEEFDVVEDWTTIKGVTSFATGDARTACVKGRACRDRTDVVVANASEYFHAVWHRNIEWVCFIEADRIDLLRRRVCS